MTTFDKPVILNQQGHFATHVRSAALNDNVWLTWEEPGFLKSQILVRGSHASGGGSVPQFP